MADKSSGLELTIVKFAPVFYQIDGGIEAAINKVLSAKRDEAKDGAYKGDFSCHDQGCLSEREDQYYWSWVYGYRNDDKPKWVDGFLSFFPGLTASASTITAGNSCFNGIVAVKNGSEYYGLLFGRAILLFRRHFQSNFGIELAKKVFNISTIKDVKAKHIGTTTNRSEREFYEPSFYLPEEGETVASIAGEITPYGSIGMQDSIAALLTYCVSKAEASFDFFAVTLLTTVTSLDSIRRIVACIAQISNEPAKPQCPLPVLTPVSKENVASVQAAFYAKLMDPKEELHFCVSSETLNTSASIRDLGPAHDFIIANDDFSIQSGDLASSREMDIRQFLIDHSDTFTFFDEMGVFALFGNDAHRKIGNFLAFFDAEIDIDGAHYCLYRGRWWQYNEELMRQLKIKVEQCWAFCHKTDRNNFSYHASDIENWSEKRKTAFCSAFSLKNGFPSAKTYDESKYNYLLSLEHEQTIGLFDRCSIPGNKLNVEPCDLFDKMNRSLIHVKIGGASDLAAAFRQALDSAKLLKDAKKTIKSRYGPDFNGEFSDVEVLFFYDGKTDFDITKARSFSLWIAFTDWFQGIVSLNLNPVFVVGRTEK